jgi:hypothetical protein
MTLLIRVQRSQATDGKLMFTAGYVLMKGWLADEI